MKRVLSILIVCLLLGCSAPQNQENVPDAVEKTPDSAVESDTDKTRSEWIEFIKESGVFDSYCTNKAVITFDMWDNKFDIKAQPKDIPTISVSQNSDGTFSSISNYIIEKEFTYVKNQVTKRAVLTITVRLNQGVEDYVECRLYVPNADDNYYNFYYEPELDYIYLHGKADPMIFASDLQDKIISTCRKVMNEIEKLDLKAHDLMEEILIEKGYEEVVWKQPGHEEVFVLDECDAIYPLMGRFYKDAVYRTVEGYYIVEKDGLYGVIDCKRNLLMNYISAYAPFADFYEDEIHLHIRTLGSASIQKKVEGTSFVVCSGEHGTSGFGYVGDTENWELKKYYLPDGGPRNSVSLDLSFMKELAGVYEEGSDFEYNDEYQFEEFSTTGKYGIFNVRGLVTSADYSDALLTMGVLVPIADENQLWGYVDANGNEIISCEYEASMPLWNTVKGWPVVNDCIILKDAVTGKYGVKALNGEILADFNCDFIGWIDEAQMVGRIDDVWYFKNSDGWVVNNE